MIDGLHDHLGQELGAVKKGRLVFQWPADHATGDFAAGVAQLDVALVGAAHDFAENRPRFGKHRLEGRDQPVRAVDAPVGETEAARDLVEVRAADPVVRVGADGAGSEQALLASPVFISEVQSGESLLYRVRVGPMTAAGELQSVQQQLRTAGYDAGQPLP